MKHIMHLQTNKAHHAHPYKWSTLCNRQKMKNTMQLQQMKKIVQLQINEEH